MIILNKSINNKAKKVLFIRKKPNRATILFKIKLHNKKIQFILNNSKESYIEKITKFTVS